MKTKYIVQEKSAIVNNCWLGLNRGHFFDTKEDAQKYFTRYQAKHTNVILRIAEYEWIDEHTVNVKEVK